MKAGFDAKRAFLNNSGLGNYSRTTLNALKDYHPDNHYVLFTPEINDELFPNYHEFDVISPDSSFSKIFKSLWRSFSLSGQLKKHSIDIFHGLSNELPDGIHNTDVPSVVTIHDLVFMRYPDFYKPVDRNIYYRKVKYACQSATRIVAISNQTKEDIIHYFKVPPEKIELVYQAVGPVYFEKQDTSALLEKYELPEKFMLCVGTIEHRKNQLTLLKAIKAKKIEMPVVFVGRPTLYATELVKFISENNMDNQVKFLSQIPENELAGLYQIAEASVYISLFEGFGLPVIEAMACGCPVLTSNVSCLPETAGEAALLCDPLDEKDIGKKLSELLENEETKKSLIEKGKERSMLFHPENYSKKLISLYSGIIELEYA
ncbi:MAG TPA: glycosyltransferase family 1 protein [Prolixibacteraceae bacterium]|nr:glycosyltransferase family 1 protein [Prolixibacteraceae bacterium]